MTRVINCECGFVVRGETDEEIVAIATKHAKEVHGLDVTREQVLAMAQPA